MSDRFAVQVDLWAPGHLSATEVAEMVDDKLRASGSTLVIEHVHAQRRQAPGGKLDQRISVRIDPVLVAAARHYAREHEMSFSDVVRESVTQFLSQDHPGHTADCEPAADG